MMKRMFFIAVFLSFAAFSYCEPYQPYEVVSNVIEDFLKKNFSNILNYTELNEKKRTEILISEYYSGNKSLIDAEISNLKEYRVIETYYEGEFAVVRVEWKLRGKAQEVKGTREYEARRYIMYLLKKFDEQWKIISKKVEI
jgi:hypothetical protein